MKALALIAFAAVAVSAQQVLPPPAQSAYAYDCSTLSSAYASPGCASYNQSIVKQDKDVMSTLKENDIKLVCFRPGKDFFAIIAYNNPFILAPDPKNSNVSDAYGFGTYSSYKNGVRSSSEVFSGEWSNLKGDRTPTFHGNGVLNPHSRLTVTDAEVDYYTDYRNLKNTTTSYTVQVRLSTLRYGETFSAAKSQAKTATRTQISYSGYCAEFKKRK